MNPRSTQLSRRPCVLPDPSSANGGCVLLNMLPTELACLIADQLPLDGKFVLRETCSALRNILEKRYLLSAQIRQFSNVEETERFLHCIGKERSDVWVCSWCLCFHQNDGSSSFDVHDMDLPRCWRSGPSGPFNLQSLLIFGYQQGHVQLALKYARLADRLGPPYDLHRRLLMRAYSGPMGSPGYSSITYKIFPRIVAGRFLVYKEYKYKLQSTVDLQQTLGLRRQCCHMGFNDLSRAQIDFLARFTTPDKSTLVRQFHVVCRACQMQIDFRQKGTSVRTRTWEDFGTETTLTPATVNFAYLPHVGDSSRPETVKDLYDSTLASPDAFYKHRAAQIAQANADASPRSESPSSSGSSGGGGGGSNDSSGSDNIGECVLRFTRCRLAE